MKMGEVRRFTDYSLGEVRRGEGEVVGLRSSDTHLIVTMMVRGKKYVLSTQHALIWPISHHLKEGKQ